MSEAAKPVETPIVAPTTEAPVETPAPVETKPTEETPAPVAETAEPVVEEAAPVKEEVKPVEEGVLGYKGPGLLKSIFATKKFFFFGTEPVEHKSLSTYLRGEEGVESANHNAAWASHTGAGLLFMSKKGTDKATPSYVFNLAEVTDITADSLTELHFQAAGHKHTLIAHSPVERDSWVSQLKLKSEEAKTLSESIKETEGYKTTIASLTKPVAAPSAAPKKSTELKDKVEAVKEEAKEEKAEKAEAKEEKKVEKAEAKEEKKEEKTRKSRSASRKRTSIFGSIGFGKKEEKSAEIKEETPVAPTETAAAPVEPVVAPVEPVVAPTEPVAAPTKEASPEPAVAPETRPTASKRNSIFDSFKSFTHKEKKPEEKKIEEPAATKEPEPVSESAPVIPAVESSEPLSTTVAAPVAPVEETPATNGESKVETPAVAPKSDKRKSSLPWLSKKKETTTSDEEGEKAEKPLSPFAKLRATVKAKSSPKAEKATTEKTPEPVEAKKEEPAVEEPVKTEPTPITATTPQVAATA